MSRACLLHATNGQMGFEGFVDKIGDETVATDAETLMAHLEKVEHPVLTLESLI